MKKTILYLLSSLTCLLFFINPLSAQTGNLMLVGIGHGPLSGAPKFVELYAINDIPDLSIYGLGNANNGGGTDSVEYSFPVTAVAAGTTFYVSNESAPFMEYMGFAATYEDGGAACNFNGDDAMELFADGVVIDVYGDINVDGTGESWEYSKGWVKRINETGPDGAAFMVGNWTNGGIDALDASMTNATATNPYPTTPYQFDGGTGGEANSLILVGLLHANADVKVSQYYVAKDIPDMSIYGLGCANNGGGTDGIEWMFPAGTATAGEYLWVGRDTMAFIDYFGFEANYYDSSGSAHNFNGDDAWEVFENGVVADVFGDINVDGTDESWEYSTTWVQRKCATGPDGAVFVLDNWIVSTLDGLDGTTTNASAPMPYDIEGYKTTPCDPIGPGEGDGGTDLVITEIMYNSPGTDLEFIELYNNTADNIDLTGYTISNAVDYTFSTFILPPGATALVSDDSITFKAQYGFDAFQWSGSLNNSGEPIVIRDAMGMIRDTVEYGDGGDWTSTPDGRGPSLILCDANADNNDGTNWQRAITPTGILVDGREVFANPNALAPCVDQPIIGIQSAEALVGEADGELTILFYIDNPNGMETTVEVDLMGTGTAENGTDYTFMSQLITFPAMTDTAQSITIPIIDDADQEAEENFVLVMRNETNEAIVANNTMDIRILDNDAPITNGLKIIGLVHGPLSGVPKATQLYATEDIPNLSLFGLGCANNGGGSDGQEYTFPNVAIDKGDCFWVANDTLGFRQYFGFSAEFQDDGSANNFNGDDAFEVFENGAVIDVFGEIDVDGTDSAWEYSNGWARRKGASGPDGSTFVLDNWEISGVDALVGTDTNEMATNPYPLGACNPSSVENVDLSSEIKVYPNPADQLVYVSSVIDLERIVITDLLGKEVQIISQPSNYTKLDVSKLESNLYIISFVSENRRWSQKMSIVR